LAPKCARWNATEQPITPAPMTIASKLSIPQTLFLAARFRSRDRAAAASRTRGRNSAQNLHRRVFEPVDLGMQ
jgi:hypothetical protein